MKSPRDEFLGEQIQVTIGDKPGWPSAFIWRQREYHIQEVWGEWPDYGFGAMPSGHWWQRRHRTYFRVITDQDEIFEIYLDHGGGRKRWYLYRRLDPSSSSGGNED